MENKPRRSISPTSKSCPFKTPPKRRLSKAVPVYSDAPRRRKRVFQPLPLAFGSYLAPSPTKKRPRTSQASVKPNPSHGELAACSSTNCGALEPESPIDDEPFDTGLLIPFTHCEKAENELPSHSEDNDDFDLPATITRIESREKSLIPEYLELLQWSPCSVARITHRCFVVQEWDPHNKALKVNSCLVDV